MARAMVLCAGFGSRLRPLSDELPKPLLPFGDQSFLAHAVASFRAAGFDRVVANTHHLHAEFERRLAAFGGALELVHEPVLLGTAGGVAGARSLLSPAPVLVSTGDVVLSRIPEALLASAEYGGLTLAVAPRPAQSGTVGIGARGEVVRLRGESFGDEVSGGDYIGLCAIGGDALAALPARGCLIGDYALPVLRRGGEVRTFAFTEPFELPGDDLTSYLKAQLRWLEAKKLRHFVGVGASVAGEIELEQAIVGEGATVRGRGVLSRSVVLPGATAEAPLRDAIVAPSGRVIEVAWA